MPRTSGATLSTRIGSAAGISRMTTSRLLRPTPARLLPPPTRRMIRRGSGTVVTHALRGLAPRLDHEIVRDLDELVVPLEPAAAQRVEVAELARRARRCPLRPVHERDAAAAVRVEMPDRLGGAAARVQADGVDLCA